VPPGKGTFAFLKLSVMAKVKRSSPKPKKKEVEALSIINPNAAGIDIGDTIHAVAVSPASAEDPVRIFGTMTCDLRSISEWLKECKVNTVAMESTGVYWKPLFSHLVREGFEVFLVNARNVKNVSGRKTDQSDAAWLQKLHSCGLLSSSYLPGDQQEALRTLVRFRQCLVSDSSRYILRMQKSLELMNIKLHTVISDITGRTGTAIVEAILAGERNAEAFLPLVNSRIKADSDTIVKSLEGTWRTEHLFTLGQSYEMYCYYKARIEACDEQIQQHLLVYEAMQNDGEVKTDTELKAGTKGNATGPKKKKQKNSPKYNVRDYLHHILKTDVIAIYGISDVAGLQILSETGTDMSKWPTEKHFVSWLNLCPNNKLSGGKLISSHVLKGCPSIAGQAFRAAANSLQNSDHWLGDYFRRMKAKGGNKYAIVATANKIATIYYKMVLNGTSFNPPNLDDYQNKRKEQKIKYLERKLLQLKGETNTLVV
jgi:transposase